MMKINIFEKGFNYSQDGEGNRLVYHLSACNMRCPWCSNPEGMKKDGKEYDLSDIINEIISCKPMYFDGGGVTFTGGECTLQADALCEIVKEINKHGINSCIETNADTPHFLSVATVVDHVILDYKSPLKSRLFDITGGNLNLIESNIKEILKHKKIHIRIPLIHNFNDDEESMTGFVNFFKSLEGEFDVEILPYHEYGKEKWLKTGKKYTVTDGFTSKETVKIFSDTLKNNCVKIIKT